MKIKIERAQWIDSFKFGFLAAIVYLIPTLFYIDDREFGHAWLLFVGNGMFLLALFFYAFKLTRKMPEGKTGIGMIAAGLLTTAIGVLLTVILLFIVISVDLPGIFKHLPPADDIQSMAPAQMQGDRTNGFLFMLFADAVLANFLSGSFISFIISYAAKQDQTEDLPAKM